MAKTKATKTTKAKPAAKPTASERRAEELAAIGRVAKRDPARAERELVALLPTLRTQREFARAAKILLSLGTDEATAHALELFFEENVALPVHKLAVADRERLYRAIAAQLPSIPHLTDDDILLPLDVIGACEDEALSRELRHSIAMMLVEREGVPEHARVRAIESLVATGDPALVARLAADDPSLPFEVRARVALATDPRSAYDRYVADFRDSTERRDFLMDLFDDKADPRWIHEVLAIVSWHPPTITGVLARMRAADELADLAARPELDDIARSALHALARLGDPRASRFLVEWLKLPAGQERAPMILTALGECGDREAAAYLKTQLANAGARTPFYQLAIDEISARTGAK